MQLSNMDLPAPFGPIRPTISPYATVNETSESACRPENDSDRSRSSRSAMRHPARGTPQDFSQADQAAGKKLNTKNKCHAVNHHLGVLELAQQFGRKREIGAAEQRASARMQPADHGHAQERERDGER